MIDCKFTATVWCVRMATLLLFFLLINVGHINCYIFELWSTEQLDDMIMSDAYKKVRDCRILAKMAIFAKIAGLNT